VGKVISLTPGVFLEREGTKTPLALYSMVRDTDTIVTDASGRARILFHDDGAVTLGPNTSLALLEVLPEGETPAFKAHLAQGLARFLTGKIVEQNPQGFAVSTPEGTAGIRGTIFVLQTGNGQTTLYVINATRDVVMGGVSVPGGFKMTLPGGLPAPMTPADMAVTQTVAAAPSSSSTGAASAAPGQAILGPLDTGDSLTPSTLADLGLATQSLGDALTPPVVTAVVTALVQGALTPGASGAIGADAAATDFAGHFSFNVNLATGAISNGAMAGSSNLFASGNGGSYTLSGGSGNMSGGSFTITGFQGTIIYANATYTADPGSYMNGAGAIDHVGGSVAGNYYIDSVSSTGWNIDQGSFSGARTQ
jgi:hypothetical protein